MDRQSDPRERRPLVAMVLREPTGCVKKRIGELRDLGCLRMVSEYIQVLKLLFLPQWP